MLHIMKAFKYIWLCMAALCFIGILFGGLHHIITMAASLLMIPSSKNIITNKK